MKKMALALLHGLFLSNSLLAMEADDGWENLTSGANLMKALEDIVAGKGVLGDNKVPPKGLVILQPEPNRIRPQRNVESLILPRHLQEILRNELNPMPLSWNDGSKKADGQALMNRRISNLEGPDRTVGEFVVTQEDDGGRYKLAYSKKEDSLSEAKRGFFMFNDKAEVIYFLKLLQERKVGNKKALDSCLRLLEE